MLAPALLVACASTAPFVLPSAPQQPAQRQPSQPQAASSDAAPKTRAEFLAELERAIADDPWFSKVDYNWSKKYADEGFAFVVQRPLKDKPGYADELADEFAPWFKKLEAMFVRDYVTPAGLVDNGGLPLFVLAVLPGQQIYLEQVDVNEAPGLATARAYYSPQKRFALTYRDLNSMGARHELHPALHEMVHALQHRYSAKREELPQSPFFNEGLAEYLSYHIDNTPEDLEKHRLDYRAVERLGVLMSVPGFESYLLPIKSAVACQGYDDALEAIFRQCMNKVPFDEDFALGCFYAQSHAYMHFLHRPERVAKAQQFVRLTLSGVDAPDALTQAFAGTSTQTLDDGFRRYVGEIIKTERPGFDPRSIQLPSEASAPIVRSGARRTPKAKAVDPAKLRPELALAEDEVEERIARAIARIERGDLERARADLAAAQLHASGELAERATIEGRRLDAWTKLRDETLASLAAKQQRIALSVEGQPLKGALVAVSEGALKIDVGGGVTRTHPIEELAAVQLAALVPKEAWSTAPDELRIYAYVLVGDLKWKKLTVAASADTKRLKEDAEASYPTLLARGTAVLALERLAERELPLSTVDAKAYCAAVAQLWTEHRKSACVARRASALRGLARASYAKLASSLELEELLACKSMRSEGDVYTLRYRFADDAEASDFVRDDSFLEQLVAREPDGSAERPGSFAPGKGGFRGAGHACWRHKLEFEAPLTVRYRVTWSEREGVENRAQGFAVGMCANAQGANIRARLAHDLFADEPGGARHVDCVGDKTWRLAQEHSVELRHDGTSVEMWLNGGRVARMANVAGRAGAVFLWSHSDFNALVTEFEIVGKLRKGALDDARAAWVDARVNELAIP